MLGPLVVREHLGSCQGRLGADDDRRRVRRSRGRRARPALAAASARSCSAYLILLCIPLALLSLRSAAAAARCSCSAPRSSRSRSSSATPLVERWSNSTCRARRSGASTPISWMGVPRAHADRIIRDHGSGSEAVGVARRCSPPRRSASRRRSSPSRRRASGSSGGWRWQTPRTRPRPRPCRTPGRLRDPVGAVRRREPRAPGRRKRVMFRSSLAGLVAVSALLVLPSAAAKDFGPGDLRVCNATRCVAIVNPDVLPQLGSFYYSGPAPARVRGPGARRAVLRAALPERLRHRDRRHQAARSFPQLRRPPGAIRPATAGTRSRRSCRRSSSGCASACCPLRVTRAALAKSH